MYKILKKSVSYNIGHIISGPLSPICAIEKYLHLMYLFKYIIISVLMLLLLSVCTSIKFEMWLSFPLEDEVSDKL